MTSVLLSVIRFYLFSRMANEKICISEDCRISSTPILAIFIFSLIFCKTHLIMIWSLYRKVHTRNWKTFLSEFKSKQLSKYRISSYSFLPRIVYAAKVLFGLAIQWLIQRSEFISSFIYENFLLAQGSAPVLCTKFNTDRGWSTC